jgi:thiosulfate/3-mercaptopyruvate sulfurtransferase
MTSPLISVTELVRRLGGDSPSLLDVRWELGTGPGRDRYERGHIPGAVFVDLDRELAGEPGARGRHPLPAADAFSASMRAAGVAGDRAVVVYDAASSTAAARGWWLLRYFGHSAVAVLDGGLAAWVAAGGTLATGSQSAAAGDFTAWPGDMAVLDAAGAADLAQRGVLLDARASERFRGETEPVDPVAGHIPGARNRPTMLNLERSGRFCDPAALRNGFQRLGISDQVAVGAYCGSGITAAHEVLALALAGFDAALYPGSWSEWITDPARPVATGP